MTAAATPATWALGILAFVTLQRLAELLVARHNTRLLLAQGAIEAAPGHYPLVVGLHAVWLAGLWYLALSQPIGAIDPFLIALFLVLQAVRFWVLATLGRRWTTRIIVVPGESLVRRGPYRWLAHPNYCVVVGEIMLLPLAFGLVWYALVFSVLNLVLLWVRIGAENKALGR